ncbi:Uncharacterised protein [Vibrio cholerae]|nr:Uncharacterised protein [Vibrio cholerae]
MNFRPVCFANNSPMVLLPQAQTPITMMLLPAITTP